MELANEAREGGRQGQQQAALCERVHVGATHSFLSPSPLAPQLRRLASSKPKHTPVIARCFQALRMAVNTERHHLKVLLADVFNHLTVGGRFGM